MDNTTQFQGDLAVAAAAAYRRPLRSSATVLAGYYLLISCLHPFFLTGVAAQILTVCALLLSGGFALAAIWLGRTQQSRAVLEWMVLVAVSAVTAKVTLHAVLANDPAQILYLPTVALAFGLLAPTIRSSVAAIAIASLTSLTFTATQAQHLAVMATAITVTTGVVAALGARLLHQGLERRLHNSARTRRLLRDLRKARLEADAAATRAAEANAAKSAFLANMSHELRTPLNGIVAVGATLEAELTTARHRDMANLIASSGRTLTALIGSILDLSKIEAERLELVDEPFTISETLVPQLELLKAQAAAKGLTMNVTVAEEARARFSGDPVRIQQIVGNLVTNAIKFTESGSIRVRLDWSEFSGLLDITVRDTGPGLSEELQARLFQRFSQADASSARRHGGAGLGLSIVKGLVQLMGGDIGVESTPGSGSTFSVSLPLAWLGPEPERGPGSDVTIGTGLLRVLPVEPSETPAPKVESQAEAEAHESALRILLAEDHPANRRVVELVLEPLGVALTSVEAGDAAVDAWERQSFDLILMDMQMPRMDGLDATRAIRTREAETGRTRTPVIMLTANAMAEHRRWSQEAGADMHVAKPFTPVQLVEAIEAALEAAEADASAGPDTVATPRAAPG